MSYTFQKRTIVRFEIDGEELDFDSPGDAQAYLLNEDYADDLRVTVRFETISTSPVVTLSEFLGTNPIMLPH